MTPRDTTRQQPSPSAKGQRTSKQTASSDRIIGEVGWDVAAINVHLEDIRRTWAKALGVSGPQWLILMAIADLDQGAGVSVGDVSAKINVRSPFVTAETKMLEKGGFVSRTASPADGRVVLMSLTEKARKAITSLAAKRRKLDEAIFADLGHERLEDFREVLSTIKRRMEKAALQLELDASKPDV
ncbi:MarR family winged helix-turn-helix transcriptional regulator [Bradyrhizobium sp. SSUT18]|uniref:MarR family winged helix-turn-helix transcriptional regulator n=1 Tax=Bradyrhizobium sp. SSUT18 TaxID=3040602 RepID=UPI00244C33EE|nr:MarR family winged helix-turn-helix transcriptional regulator [Bradyrhizobium sp. SSUT18]MDH2400225.1 MarR family winged helix-turn-helix transcriptional regulator [Bradyrhizobium sp. SSUT18]